MKVRLPCNVQDQLTARRKGFAPVERFDYESEFFKTMDREGVSSPVHFIKLPHHGGHNGTPSREILNLVLSLPAEDGMTRPAIIPTCANTCNNVPHEPAQHELGKRCQVFTAEGLGGG